MRDRVADASRAFEVVEAVAEAQVREAMAEYDAFVAPAQAVRDGLFMGTARTSWGEEIRVHVGWGDEYHHHLIQGGTGTGKSTWVARLLREELGRGRPMGVIDCKGDLFSAAIEWAAALSHTLPPGDERTVLERLLVVNPFGGELVPLNVCRPLAGCSAESQAFEVSSALARLFESSLGVHMEAVLRHLVLLLMEAGLSLVEAPLLLEDEVLRGILASRSPSRAVREFFLRTYPAVPQISKDALLSRLQGLLMSENLRLMLGADELVDLKAVLEEGRPLFVFLGNGPGVPEEQVDILGSLLVQLFFQATYARGSGERSPYLLAVDEMSRLLEAPALARRLETALTSARSFGLSLMLIHQNFAQLPATLREIVLGNVDFVALFRTSERNVRYVGDCLPNVEPTAPGGVEETNRRSRWSTVAHLPDRHCYFLDCRRPHPAVRLRVPDEPSAHDFAGVSRAALAELISKGGWDRRGAVPRSMLSSQIEARQAGLASLIRPGGSWPSRKRSQGNPSSSKKGRGPALG